MNVCFVCREYIPSLRGGGIASYIKEMAEGLTVMGHKVTVISASDDTREEKRYYQNGIYVVRLSNADFIIPEVEPISIIKKFRPIYRFNSYRKKIVEAIKDIKDIDIIEVPEFGAESLYLSELNIPVVIRLHTPSLLDHYNFCIQKLNISNWYYYLQGLKELDIIKNAKYITSCSSSLKEWAIKFADAKADNIKVIYNPINVELKKEYENIRYSQDKVKTILFAGTICDWKGCGELAKACDILSDEGFEIRLDLVGKTGSYADGLKSQYSDKKWFNLIGKVKREELMEMYGKADIVCFPSWWENMPMVCIEAMLSGAVVLGSNSGGMSEIIEDGKSGFLVEPKNPIALAKRIKEILLLNSEEKEIISNNAVERIKYNFSMKVILNQTLDYYKSVISKGKR